MNDPAFDPNRDYEGDVDITMSAEESDRSVTVGELVQIVSMMQNRLLKMADASVSHVQGDIDDYVKKMLEASALGTELTRQLDLIAHNRWTAENGE